MKWLLVLGVLHLGFAVCEIFPWSDPILLKIVVKKLELAQPIEPRVHDLLAMIVKNAGIYNLVLSGLFFWSAVRPERIRTLGPALCLGAAGAGAFGTATLRSPVTAFQCFLGLVAFGALMISRRKTGENVSPTE